MTITKLIRTLLLASAVASGYQSVQLTTANNINITVPAVTPFLAFGDYQISFRIHNWTLPGSGFVRIMRVGGMDIELFSNGNLCGANQTDTMPDGNSCVSVTGLSDVTVRLERLGSTPARQLGALPALGGPNPMLGSTYLEGIDNATGNVLALNCNGAVAGCPMSVTTTPNVSAITGFIGLSTGVSFSVAWFKWSSTTVLPGTPLPNETTPADLADFRFEGSGPAYTNQGTGGYAITLSNRLGTPTYAASPVLAPLCYLTQQVNRAGAPAQLGNFSIPFDATQTLSYVWQQTSGPSTLAWSSHTVRQPTITGSVFGSYVLNLTVVDGSGQSNSCSIKDGFVATDSNNIVTTGDPNKDMILGPQVQFGKNPWGWMDDRQKAEAAFQKGNRANVSWYNQNTPYPWDVAGQGTITVTKGSATVVGTGTNFLSTFCPGGVLASPTPYISIWYPSTLALSGVGRHTVPVASCADDTHLTMGTTASPSVWNTLGSSLLPPSSGSASGYSYAFIPGSLHNFWFNASPGPVDFYSNIQAIYSIYYRTGIDDYLTEARALADAWWVFALDSGACFVGFGDGSCFQASRNIGPTGLFLRALDGRSDMFPGLFTVAQEMIQNLHAQFISLPGGAWNGYMTSDPRENGYQLITEALCASLDPNPSDAAACRAGLSEYFYSGWIPGQWTPTGYWYAMYWGGAEGGPTKYASFTASGNPAATMTDGSSTFTCSGCTWDNTTGSTGMFNQTGRPVVWWFLNSASATPRNFADGDPVAYYAAFVNSTTGTLTDYKGNPVNYSGCAPNPSPCQKGWMSGGQGTLIAGPMVQPYMYGILGTGFDFSGKAMACVSPGVPTNCDNTVSAAAFQFNQNTANFDRLYGYWPLTKGSYYFAGSLNCTPPVPDDNITCTSSNNTQSQTRNLNEEVMHGVMTAYAHSGDPNLLAFADTLYTANWARGAYQTNGAPAGDGYYIGDYEDGYGFYLTGTPPGSAAPKYWGMMGGIGIQPSWPGYRLGGLSPAAPKKIPIPFSLTAIANTDHVTVTAVETRSGLTVSKTCTSSPCVLTVDGAYGAHQITIAYFSAGGKQLSASTLPITAN